ncbi:MAG: DUF3168 domain-containing protein [Rhodobacter sp.]|jgi:hypothetical protein|nr:DUF3168 domain-containing protein [Rhodobacter sp.]
MSYAIGAALQSAVFAAVSGDLVVQGLVGTDVFDALPAGSLPLTYVVIGEEDVQAKSDVSANGAVHRFTVSVFSDVAGFLGAKAVAVAVSDVLVDADLTLARGRLVSLGFVKARARRGSSLAVRRIDLQFRARVEDI